MSAYADSCSNGRWGPHCNAVSGTPALASNARTVSTWTGSPLCDAAATAISFVASPKRSGAPRSTNGNA